MLYLEARCIAVTRAAGAQGVQNGGIDGVSVTASVPDGMREVIAENLCVMLHDLESCTGNDTLMSASDIRRTAHTLPLLLAGADFLFSGFGSIPAYDNAFGPSNFNAEDIDDYLVVQRDWGFEGGLRARDDAELLPLRRRAAEACRAVYASSAWRRSPTRTSRPACTRTAASTCPSSPPTLVPAAGRPDHRARARRPRRRARARRARLRARGRARARDAAPAAARRLPADLGDLRRGHARAVEPQRPERLRRARDAATACAAAPRRGRAGAPGVVAGRPAAEQAAPPAACSCASSAPRAARVRPDEVVVGLSPAFAIEVWLTLGGLTVAEVLRQVLAGIEEEGVAGPRRAGAALDRRRHDRLDRRAALGLGRRRRPAGQGHGAHPPRRPAAAGNLELFSIAPRVTPSCTAASAATPPATRAARRRAAAPARVERAVRPALPRPRRAARGGRAARCRAASTPSSWRRRGRA